MGSPVSTHPNGATEDAVGDAAPPPKSNADAALGEMAHAVLNALNTVMAAAELSRLLLRRDERAEAEKALARVEPECLRAARLVRDGRTFLTFRIDATRDAVEVAALLEACAADFPGQVEVVAGSALPAIRGDADALRRLFKELLGNAFAFGANRVRITLTERGDNALRIEFHDDGPGISVLPERLFTPFFSTQPDDHSGLGLAMAARIANAHGGQVSLADSDHGARFRVELPLREA